MQVKLFWVQAPMRDKGFVVRDSGGSAVAFEKQVNDWLEQNPDVEIVHIKQSACGGSFAAPLWLISIWYTRRIGS